MIEGTTAMRTEPLLAIILLLQSPEEMSAKEPTVLHLKPPSDEA
jgi:hypothetical protein